MLKTVLSFLLFLSTVFASEHGMYLKAVQNIQNEFPASVSRIETALNARFNLLNSHALATPAILGDPCSFKAHLFLIEDTDFTKFLTAFGDKYLVAAFVKIGLYQDDQGTRLVMADPETINRIVFNDLNDKEYHKVIEKSKQFKNMLVNFLHGLNLGQNVNQPMPPIRDDEALREADKDMFMMVGPMTFFKDDDQFPVILQIKSDQDIDRFVSTIKKNLETFTPSKDDATYEEVQNADYLKWRVIAEIKSPDSKAVLLGITRPRTEALSFKIAGQNRANEDNPCPGIDHLCAYPIEVLILKENDEIIVRSAREMFRMDMYFWDAGKMAFMKYMNMPKMLDRSIKKALFKIED